MKILVVDNYPNTHLGLVGNALAEAGAEIDHRTMYKDDPLPATHEGHDGIVVLGGGQNALSDDDHPWLPKVAALTRDFGEADKAVLGICLGSQLVARGHGARNIIGRPIEFGWHEVRPTGAAAEDPVLSALGGGAPLFHWHNDTFTLPPGSVHLATSNLTEYQAFRIGRAVYGIQFHFEADSAMVEWWSDRFAAMIARQVPDWPDRFPGERARHADAADRTGLAIARAWVAQVRART
jgi:GMP synthase-like glutamine amidotransferase